MSNTVTYCQFITLIETIINNYYFIKVTLGKLLFCLILLLFTCQYLRVNIIKNSILYENQSK